jgi:hypothetical protein
MTSNSALERTAGSHSLAAAAHRNVRPQPAFQEAESAKWGQHHPNGQDSTGVTWNGSVIAGSSALFFVFSVLAGAGCIALEEA